MSVWGFRKKILDHDTGAGCTSRGLKAFGLTYGAARQHAVMEDLEERPKKAGKS
jgi:hypothetical protein